jgi:hypothetical protein
MKRYEAALLNAIGALEELVAESNALNYGAMCRGDVLRVSGAAIAISSARYALKMAEDLILPANAEVQN